MFSQGLIEEQRTRGHLLFPISVSRVGSHFSLSQRLSMGTGYDHDSCDQFSSLSALSWQLGRCKRQGSDKQEGRSGLQGGDLMGQSPWFLLQWSQAEAHSLVPLRAGRQAGTESTNGTQVATGQAWTPGAETETCLRGPSSPSVPCPCTDGMPVSLPLCPLSLKQVEPWGQTQGSIGKHTSRAMNPGSLACVRHIVVVAMGLLGSLSPGQCSEDAGSRVRHGCQC